MEKKVKVFWGIFVFLALIIITFWLWISRGPLTQAKQAVLGILPIPMATVNGSPISTKQFLQRYRIALAYYEGTKKTELEIKKQIFDQLVNEKKNEQLAAKLNAIPNQAEIDKEYTSLFNDSRQDQVSLEDKLKSLGLSQQEFKNQVLRPQAVLNKLLIWYNSQSELNKEAYALINKLKDQITQGGSFENLAIKYNQDERSKLTQGDLGYLEIVNLLPEFQEPLQAAKLGDILIVPGRYGLHLFKIEGKDNNGSTGGRIHLREIFLQSAGFEVWLADDTKNYNLKNIINLF